MKKRVLAAVCICFLLMMLAGCGGAGVPDTVETTTICIDKKGGVTYYLAGAFDREYYQLEELTSMAEKEAAEFCESAGASAVTVEKVELVPEDGWLLKPVEVTFKQGQSVFDVLQQVCKDNKLHMEFSMTPIYNSAYIEGIGNLYEFDCGEVSGWMYKVNDWFPNYGCSRYQLQDGDVVEWEYTCELGKDIGGGYATGGDA